MFLFISLVEFIAISWYGATTVWRNQEFRMIFKSFRQHITADEVSFGRACRRPPVTSALSSGWTEPTGYGVGARECTVQLQRGGPRDRPSTGLPPRAAKSATTTTTDG